MRRSSSAFRCSTAFLVNSRSAGSCSRTNFWLSVSRVSRRRGFTSVNCSIDPVASGTMKRLFCETKVDGRLVARPPRAGLGRRRPGDLLAGPGHGVEEDDVAAVGEQHAAARLVPGAAGRRRELALLVGQAPGRRRVLGEHVGRALLLAGLPPLEEEVARIAGPAQPRGRVADQVRAAHDAVDGEGQPGRRGGDRRPGGAGCWAASVRTARNGGSAPAGMTGCAWTGDLGSRMAARVQPGPGRRAGAVLVYLLGFG